MNYVVAGYAVGLSGLFCYVVSLLARRRRLERAMAVAERDATDGPVQASRDGAPSPRAEQP